MYQSFECLIVLDKVYGKKELEYDVLLDRSSIRARVEKKGKFIRILEIISLNKKRITTDEINVFHPSFEESISLNDTKKRKYISSNGKSEGELDSDGSTKESDEINTFMIKHEYERIPKLNKKKNGRKIMRNNKDKNIRTYVLYSDNHRTTVGIYGNAKSFRKKK